MTANYAIVGGHDSGKLKQRELLNRIHMYVTNVTSCRRKVK